MGKAIDKLQKYAAMQVEDRHQDVIASKETRSFYFNFHGNTLRISDHLPNQASTATMSIIMTSDPNLYVLNQHHTGRLTVVNYSQAKQLVKSFSLLGDIFRKPEVPFAMDKDVMDALKGNAKEGSSTIMGVPSSLFTPKQLAQIGSYVRQAYDNRNKVKESAARVEEHVEKLK